MLTADSKDKENILGNQFVKVPTQEDTNYISTKTSLPYPSIPRIQVQTKGVEMLLEKMKVKKAAGSDWLPSRVLKEMALEPSAHKLDPHLQRFISLWSAVLSQLVTIKVTLVTIKVTIQPT